MTHVQKTIASISTEFDPRWIEAFMRLQYGTLSHLSMAEFRSEVRLFKAEFHPDHAQLWEDVAQSYGL